MQLIKSKLVAELIKLAKAEDLSTGIYPEGDLSSYYAIPENQQATAKLFSKEKQPIVFSNQELAEEVVSGFGGELQIQFVKSSGDLVNSGESICTLCGSYREILTIERTLLNFLQRMSGIATLTREYVEKVKHTNTKILDTRKTTPGFRLLAKQAVADGGGTNHRVGLYDAIMLKDNHLSFFKDNYQAKLQPVLDQIKTENPNLPVIIEVDTLEQFEIIRKLQGVDRILLDNMTLEQLQKAVAANQSQLDLEASGGVGLSTVQAIAETGVDYISVGALTHSAVAVDLSLDITF